MITDEEIRMTIKTLASKGVAKRAIARQLSLSEGTVRYHLRRIAAQAINGRARHVRRAATQRFGGGVGEDELAESCT